MKHKRKRLGARLVGALEDGLRHIEAGKPLRQSVVRRMRVKGKVVWVRETFEAPLKRD